MIDRPRIRFHVEEAEEIGFVVMIDGRTVAALTSRAELAEWVERHCGTPDTIEREQREIAEVQQTLPRVVASRGKGFFGGNRT